jgi:hypothetical protein
MRRERDGPGARPPTGFKVDEERLGEAHHQDRRGEAEITEFHAAGGERDAVKAVLEARTAYTALKPGEDPAPARRGPREANATWDAMRAARR